jgi:hypothetical protein
LSFGFFAETQTPFSQDSRIFFAVFDLMQMPFLSPDCSLTQTSPTAQSCPFSQGCFTGADVVGTDDIIKAVSAAKAAIRSGLDMGCLPQTCAKFLCHAGKAVDGGN